jgi:hypothetical protein
MKSSRSSLFGSVQLSGLRSARQILPKTFRDLGPTNNHLKNGNNKVAVPSMPKLTCKQQVKRGVKTYLNSCIDGMFLKHIFCKAIPLRCYLFFMASTDFLLALIDIANLYSRI